MNTSKKIQKYKYILFTLLLLTVNPAFLRGETADEPQAADFTLNNIWEDGKIETADTVNYYKFTLKQTGCACISYLGLDIQNSEIEILNADFSKSYAYGSVYGSSAVTPVNKTFTLAFEPGTYYIKVQGALSNTGSYKLKGSFRAADSKVGSNHTFDTAANLELNKPITGFISQDSKTDFYKIALSTPKRILFTYTSHIPDSCLQIWNSEYTAVFTKKIRNASETAPVTNTFEEALPAGTYYIKIYPYGSSYGGQYTLNCGEKLLVTDITVSGANKVTAGKKLQLKASVCPSGADKTIRWSSDDTSVASVDTKTGLVTARKTGTVTITAAAQDDSNVTKNFRLIVTPAKMSKPSAYVPQTGEITVSWHSLPGVSGYQIQYSTNRSFKKASAVKVRSGKINKTIRRLSPDKKYYVRIRAYYKSGKKTYYGKWSRKNTVTQTSDGN